ncbi:MAG: class I SAM-dependent methyltransferase [Simkaniaceae bacterium]|nr:class I SAM-dependent methyltransferase [Simkaniaceae bacterium]
MNKYQLLDSGNEQKIEAFGPCILKRPSAQALWSPKNKQGLNLDSTFVRDSGWTKPLRPWQIEHHGLKFKLMPNEFGHVGLFPEHATHWSFLESCIEKGASVLNLFAYTGGATLACAKAGAAVCHVDASKKTVSWARENAELNGLQNAKIRYIVDDAIKFMRREVKRGISYDGIILDPPTFGRGPSGELFKIEKEIQECLQLAQKLLSKKSRFLLFTSHTPGFTPTVMKHLLEELKPKSQIEIGEMFLQGSHALDLPSGSYGRFADG